MSQSLKILRVTATVGRILSMIVFITCIIGASFCLAGIIGVTTGFGVLTVGSATVELIDFDKLARILTEDVGIMTAEGTLTFGSLTIEGFDLIALIRDHTGEIVRTVAAALAAGMLVCAGEAVVAKFAEVYFRRRLEEGDPFTRGSARETIRLGILAAAVPLVASNLAGLVFFLLSAFGGHHAEFSLSNDSSFAVGLMVILLGIVFLYAAERLEGKTPAGASDETKPEEAAPAGEIPAGEIPAEEAPAGETPAEEAPAGETPAEEASVGETPAEKLPADESTAAAAPISDAPEETPHA